MAFMQIFPYFNKVLQMI